MSPIRRRPLPRPGGAGRAAYYVGHRGAGDVAPEHTLPSYLQAAGWRADAIEISVGMSSDGVLFCNHDLTLDRTSTLTGVLNERTAAELDQAKVSIPRLGPAWAGARAPALPRLDAVLDALGADAHLCIEPKLDAAYPALVETINRRSIASRVMIKLPASSPRIPMARQDGLAVFAYLGNPDVATAAGITTLGRQLNADRDALVLTSQGTTGLIADDLVKLAVQTGVPVWMVPVHRRYEAQHFLALGAKGLVTPDLGYLAALVPPASADAWASGRISPGELTRDPYSDNYAISWPGDGVIALSFPNRMSFLTLGNLCPITQPSYRLSVAVSFDPLPSDPGQAVEIAFGHVDDRYYEHRKGDSDGYHVMLHVDGQLAVRSHQAGTASGEELSAPVQSGSWDLRWG